MTYTLKTSIYTCKKCDHEWEDAKQAGYEHCAFEYGGCPECNSKDVKWEHKPPEVTERQKVFSTPRMGKPPKDFVEGVLKRIKDNHSGYYGDKSSINLDH